MSTLQAPTPLTAKPRAACSNAKSRQNRIADYMALAKPRISVMVLFTVSAGFLLASAGSPDWLLLVHSLIGVGLVAAGTNALNQYLERDVDARMERTKDRPVPAGRLRPIEALAFGVLTACVGFVYLAVLVNPLTAFLAVVTLGLYVFAYTPLKRRTTFNTLVGAIPGALPPVLGWTAAVNGLNLEAWTLFLILFLWQFPHFWAIAWLHRHDYARAGLRMLPLRDREGGRMTGRLMVQQCLVLVLASVAPAFIGLAGPRFFWGALLAGGMFTAYAVRFLLTPSDQRARHVLRASLVYLPVIWMMLLLDGPFMVFPEL
jgi:heme o synthase